MLVERGLPRHRARGLGGWDVGLHAMWSQFFPLLLRTLIRKRHRQGRRRSCRSFVHSVSTGSGFAVRWLSKFLVGHASADSRDTGITRVCVRRPASALFPLLSPYLCVSHARLHGRSVGRSIGVGPCGSVLVGVAACRSASKGVGRSVGVGRSRSMPVSVGVYWRRSGSVGLGRPRSVWVGVARCRWGTCPRV